MLSTIRSLVNQLWVDDCGAILTTEYLALGSIVVLGGVGGMVAMRDSMNGEMAEYGNSVRSMRQSYAAPGFSAGGATTSGSAANNAAGGASGYVSHLDCP